MAGMPKVGRVAAGLVLAALVTSGCGNDDEPGGLHLTDAVVRPSATTDDAERVAVVFRPPEGIAGCASASDRVERTRPIRDLSRDTWGHMRNSLRLTVRAFWSGRAVDVGEDSDQPAEAVTFYRTAPDGDRDERVVTGAWRPGINGEADPDQLEQFEEQIRNARCVTDPWSDDKRPLVAAKLNLVSDLPGNAVGFRHVTWTWPDHTDRPAERSGARRFSQLQAYAVVDGYVVLGALLHDGDSDPAVDDLREILKLAIARVEEYGCAPAACPLMLHGT